MGPSERVSRDVISDKTGAAIGSSLPDRRLDRTSAPASASGVVEATAWRFRSSTIPGAASPQPSTDSTRDSRVVPELRLPVGHESSRGRDSSRAPFRPAVRSTQLIASRHASRCARLAAFLEKGRNGRRDDYRLQAKLPPRERSSSRQEPPDNLSGPANARRHRYRVAGMTTRLRRPRTSAPRPSAAASSEAPSRRSLHARPRHEPPELCEDIQY